MSRLRNGNESKKVYQKRMDDELNRRIHIKKEQPKLTNEEKIEIHKRNEDYLRRIGAIK